MEKYIKSIILILEDTEAFERRFGIKFNVPLKVDYKIGKTWAECK
jgi:DNA polymerase I-like protein with 3'-5' exonuclease and polymerase domains